MKQYSYLPEYQVLDKSDKQVTVTSFRGRMSFPANFTYIDSVKPDDILRPDIRVLQLYEEFKAINLLIDANETDIFSFKLGENLLYPDREFVDV